MVTVDCAISRSRMSINILKASPGKHTGADGSAALQARIHQRSSDKIRFR